MYYDIHYNQEHIHKFDEESLLTFFDLELKQYLNDKSASVDSCSSEDIELAFIQWQDNYDFDNSYYPFSKYKNSFINNGVDHEDLKELLSELSELKTLFHSIINDTNDVNEQLYLIKELLIEFNINEYTDLLNFTRDIFPIDYNFVTNVQVKNIFRSVEANKWFIEIIDERFGRLNGKTRYFNAFLKAIIDDEDVQKHIFFDHFKQKSVVEYVNHFYGDGKNDIIKDPDKLSDPIKHKPYVNDKIKDFIKFSK